MSETKTPGIQAKHLFVTDSCRDLHGDDNAIDVAVKELEAEAKRCIRGWPKGDGHKLHFVLTIERGNAS